jgi:catechol 2,3-dioxygenase-like lactoylglutathione lyase family enzyme
MKDPGKHEFVQDGHGVRYQVRDVARSVAFVHDLSRCIDALKKAGLHFRNDMETGPAGSQIQVEDPDGNPIELFEPAR